MTNKVNDRIWGLKPAQSRLVRNYQQAGAITPNQYNPIINAFRKFNEAEEEEYLKDRKRTLGY